MGYYPQCTALYALIPLPLSDKTATLRKCQVWDKHIYMLYYDNCNDVLHLSTAVSVNTCLFKLNDEYLTHNPYPLLYPRLLG